MKKTFLIATLVIAILSVGCSKTKDPEMPEEKGTATIYGYAINKATNAPIQGVLVTIMPGSMNKFTGSDGTYQFDNLSVSDKPTQYTLTAQKEGFQDDRKSVIIKVDDILEVNLALQPE